MARCVILLRGINVGGRNRVPMAELRACLEQLGLTDVRTYIASGNVIARSSKGVQVVQQLVEAALPTCFNLDTEVVRVLVLTEAKLRHIVEQRPTSFGEQPDMYHSDAIFLMGITTAQAMEVFQPRDGVDEVWPGRGVIYSRRVSAQRTKSRLGRIVGTEPYRSMTIRSWQTTTKLLELLDR